MLRHAILPALVVILVVASIGVGHAQTPASFAQQIAVAKTMVQDLQQIGVLTSNLSDKELESINRAAAGQGVKLFIGKVKDMASVATMYKTLVSDKGSQIIWIPNAEDALLSDMGFKYLRESTVRDRVGLLVPNDALVPSGALCSILSEGGKVKAYVNQRVAAAVGANIPGGTDGPVTYVLR